MTLPTATIKKFAKRSGKSVQEVEQLWDEIKQDVANKTDTQDPSYWPIVVSVLKKRLGIAESFLSQLLSVPTHNNK